MARKRSKPPQEPEKTLLQEGTESLSAAQRALSEQIPFVAEQLAAKRADGRHDDRLSSHLAFLGEKQATITREIRQLEDHERAAAEAMSAEEADGLVVSYVLDLPVERYDRLLAAIVARRPGRSPCTSS